MSRPKIGSVTAIAASGENGTRLIQSSTVSHAPRHEPPMTSAMKHGDAAEHPAGERRRSGRSPASKAIAPRASSAPACRPARIADGPRLARSSAAWAASLMRSHDRPERPAAAASSGGRHEPAGQPEVPEQDDEGEDERPDEQPDLARRGGSRRRCRSRRSVPQGVGPQVEPEAEQQEEADDDGDAPAMPIRRPARRPARPPSSGRRAVDRAAAAAGPRRSSARRGAVASSARRRRGRRRPVVGASSSASRRRRRRPRRSSSGVVVRGSSGLASAGRPRPDPARARAPRAGGAPP